MPRFVFIASATLFLSIFVFSLVKLVNFLFLFPRRLEIHFRRQGIDGPLRRLIFGNVGEIRDLIARAQASPLPDLRSDVVRRVLPQVGEWSARYGKVFVFWFGLHPRLVVADAGIAREALSGDSGGDRGVDKAGFNPLTKQLFGDGLVGLTGRKWFLHRRVVSPAFSMERVKGWVPVMSDSVLRLLDKWVADNENKDEFEVDIHKEFSYLASDIIARVAFGSNYEEGMQIFKIQDEQMLLVSIAFRSVYIPGFRFVPTVKNRRRWKINRNIRSLIRKQIEKKAEECENSKNLLGLMLAANKKEGEGKLEIDEIIDECKTFYFAGKDTTASLLTWAVFLLAAHEDWQSETRNEIITLSGQELLPTSEVLGNLKILNMVVKETLRLYPPAVFLNRKITKDVKLGKYNIPKDTNLFIPIVAIHRDVDIWGSDAGEFNPSRFSTDSRPPPLGSYLPFGLGPANCVGQNLAIVEVKVALAKILQRFTFRVSSSYAHAPILLMTLQPQYGVQIMFQKI